jgi:hypothetical protein
MNSLTDRKETTGLASRISTLSCARITLSTVKLSLSLCFRAYGIKDSPAAIYITLPNNVYRLLRLNIRHF